MIGGTRHSGDAWPVGQTIIEVRHPTPGEADLLGWDEYETRQTMVVVLGDGSVLIPGRDQEGNGGGALWGIEAPGVRTSTGTRRVVTFY